MALINRIYDRKAITRGEMKTFLRLLNPFAPHLTEEMWQAAGFEGLLAKAEWPVFDESKTVENEIEIPVQINGKLRAVIQVDKNLSKEDVLAAAKADGKISPQIEGKTVVKEICVPGKLVNLVVK